MQKLHKFTILVGLLWLCFPSLGGAQELWPRIDRGAPVVKANSQDAAVIISIEEYSYLPQVAGAAESGRDWMRWFTKSRGMEMGRVKWLNNRDATRGAMLDELGAMSKKVGPKGTLWVVFIGHGAPSQNGKDGVLLSLNAQASNPREFYGESITRTEFEQAARGGKPRQVVMVLDACFSGQTASREPLLEGMQVGLMVDAPNVSSNVTMLTAAASDQFAGQLPGVRRPAFSYLVLGGLRGWADKNQDGEVTVNEVIEYTNYVLGSTLHNTDQTPQASGDKEAVLASFVKRSARESGPDLVEILEKLKIARPSIPGELPPPVGITEPDFGFDLEAAKALVGFNEKLEYAHKLEDDLKYSPEDKIKAWQAVEKFSITGQDAKKNEAKQLVSKWENIASSRSRMRTKWAELSQALPLATIDEAQKLAALKQFVGAYEALGPEAELKKAREALGVLERGGTFIKPKTAEKPVKSKMPEGFVRIEPGRFLMGSPASEPGRDDNETPHEVRITRAYYLQTTPVTVGQWNKMMTHLSLPSWSRSVHCGTNCPAEVSWDNAVRYANKLSRKEGLQECYGGYVEDYAFVGLHCTGYRLPTEAEWEYAARAGTRGARYGDLDSIGWYKGNDGEKMHPVGQKKPNKWGLYDMLGNPYEWAYDFYSEDLGSAGITDPTGPVRGRDRVARGGGWKPSFVRAAARTKFPPTGYDLSFRLARTVSP